LTILKNFFTNRPWKTNFISGLKDKTASMLMFYVD
jgi:hypothetical protein